MLLAYRSSMIYALAIFAFAALAEAQTALKSGPVPGQADSVATAPGPLHAVLYNMQADLTGYAPMQAQPHTTVPTHHNNVSCQISDVPDSKLTR